MATNGERFPPQLQQFDALGKRIDMLHLSQGWKFMVAEAAKEMLISIPYQANASKNARLHQLTKLMLFNPSSSLVSCPLSMTDGAVFTLRSIKRQTP